MATITLLLADADLARQLGHRLAEQGHRVRESAGLELAADAPGEPGPQVVLTDALTLQANPAAASLLQGRLQRQGMPLLVAGDARSLDHRRLAARCGAARFIGQPIDLDTVLANVDAWCERPGPRPLRTLVAGPLCASTEARVDELARGGCTVHLEGDAARLFDALYAHALDVLVLLPGFRGVSASECLQLLRQDEAFDDLMAVVVLADPSQAGQMPDGTRILLEPVSAPALVAAVRDSAARRRRWTGAAANVQRLLAVQAQARAALDAHALVSVTDARGCIVQVNDHFCRTSGYTRDELLGRNHRIVKSGRHPPEVYAALWRTIGRGEIWQGDLCNRRKDGSLYWVSTTIMPMPATQGRPRQYLSIRTDITTVKRVQQVLRQRVRQQKLLNGLAARLMRCNQGRALALIPPLMRLSARLIGADRAQCFLQAAGGHALQPIGSWTAAGRTTPAWAAATVDALWARCDRTGVVQVADVAALLPPGSADATELGGVQSLLLVPLLDGGGMHGFLVFETQPHRYALTSRDEAFVRALAHLLAAALARARAEDEVASSRVELARQVQQLEHMGRLAEVGSWVVDAASGALSWSAQTCRIHGIDPEVPVTLQTAVAFCAPEARPHLDDALQRALRHGHPFELELPIVTADGESRWVRMMGAAQFAGQAVAQVSGAIQDISPRKAAEAALIHARDEAERANRAKSDFLASMSHELRTPMNAILGFGQLLELDLDKTSRHHPYVQEMLRAGRHLLELIDDVLNLAHIESGHVQLSLDCISLVELVDNCLGLLTPLAQRRGITVQVQGLRGLHLHADRVRLRQVIINLLSNAIKYNVEGGRIEISAARRVSGRVRLAVRDTGPGIAPERQHELFQPFSRLGAEGGTVEGTGIGLVIVRQLVELMSGQVGVSSAPGHGSLFWVELPADDRGAAPTAGARPDRPFGATTEVTHARSAGCGTCGTATQDGR